MSFIFSSLNSFDSLEKNEKVFESFLKNFRAKEFKIQIDGKNLLFIVLVLEKFII